MSYRVFCVQWCAGRVRRAAHHHVLPCVLCAVVLRESTQGCAPSCPTVCSVCSGAQGDYAGLRAIMSSRVFCVQWCAGRVRKAADHHVLPCVLCAVVRRESTQGCGPSCPTWTASGRHIGMCVSYPHRLTVSKNKALLPQYHEFHEYRERSMRACNGGHNGDNDENNYGVIVRMVM